ncbi:MAG: ArsB/NhaD family transporter [Candidatus Peregrinibacteria bacterium]|nr:ArsB/NhaD family transporter [Candidatus Peregrinibacteria bacterium]MDZ4244925.1 ArsB/NhaD family transporter [Candidatus Gracilibacteria bacterium]
MLLPALIFIAIFVLIIFEVYDKAILASLGAILMIAFGVIDFHQAIESIEFETIILLMSMMLLVEVSRESGIFSWLTVKMARYSKGNPLLIFLLFSLTTAFLSAFLDNVTTIVLIVPVTISLVKGMGRDPKPYIIAEILFSNIGGTLTLIGDPPNIIIGGAVKLSFIQFIQNLWLPVLASLTVIILIFVTTHWKNHFKPIASDLRKLFLSHVLIRKIAYKFLHIELSRVFMIKSISVIILTILGFFFQKSLGVNVGVIAFSGAILLLLISSKEVKFEHSLRKVEWATLLFFCGLFVMVGAIEHVGLLEKISDMILQLSDGKYITLLLTVLWVSGFTSMILDNIPFVTLMIPVIFSIQAQIDPNVDASLLWWALSLGACLGGNGTMIGASANVIGLDLAKKDNVHISFLQFFKYGFPLTILSLGLSSAYLFYRVMI